MSSSDLISKLNRYKNQIAPSETHQLKSELNTVLKILTKATSGKIQTNEYGQYLLLKHDLIAGSSYGKNTVNFDTNKKVLHNHFSKDETDGFTNTKDLLFFDIESTGLSGAGAVPFLVGFGSIVSEKFEVRQYFLPDFPDERAMLTAIAEEIKPNKTLVSYNGITFDIQFLKERFILNRLDHDLSCYHHIDLLHSCRRLYKRRLGSCTLGNIEEEILGFERFDDIPGYLVPSVYFSWVSNQETDKLMNVLDHNKFDIFSLLLLLTEIDSVFESEGKEMTDPNDIYSLSRIYNNRKKDEKVIELLESQPVTNKTPDILFLHSIALKRKKDWENASSIWLELSNENSDHGFRASIELAKYYEHKEKSLEKALNLVIKAKSISLTCNSEDKLLQHRENRLRRKLSC